MSETQKSWLVDLIVLFVAIFAFYSIGLGARPYLAPSEARYIEIPRQMLTTGDWLTPHINGVPYFEKPPLFYWMQAATMKIFGDSEFAGRISTVKCMTLLCLITYALGRMLYGRRSGLLAASVLATSLMGYALSRIATLDVPVTLFLTATLASFLAAQYCHPERSERSLQRSFGKPQDDKFYYLMFTSAALAVMTKGLIGIVIPGLVIGAWIALTNNWRILARVPFIRGTLLFLAIAAPWHIWMSLHHPAFADFYFIHEHVTRFVSDEHKRKAPWWFFIAITAAGLVPWAFTLPLRGRAGVGALLERDVSNKAPLLTSPLRGEGLFLLLWILLPLLFFSASHSKLIPYIFPIFPPIAILLGKILCEYWERKRPAGRLRYAALAVILLFGITVIAVPFLPSLPGKLGAKLAVLTAITPLMLLPMASMLLLLLCIVLKKHSARVIIIGLAAFGIITGVSVNTIAARLDPATIKPLALHIQPQPDDMVVAFHSYWQDIPVYLNRNITVVEWSGELNFGITHYPETRAWMIDDAEFRTRCASTPHAVYLFARIGDTPDRTDCKLREIARSGNTILFKKDAQ